MRLSNIKQKFSSNVLDCTLRDGGYYNNWLFSNQLINEYIKFIERNKIKYIEIGFRFFDEIRTKGKTAYSDVSFINSLKLRKQTSIGIMFNGSDIVKFRNNKKIINYYLETIKSNKLKFIRIACHIKELDQILFFTKKIKSSQKKIMINLMQISEIKKEIKYVCEKIKKINPDVFYIADSLGSMKPSDFKIVIKQIKQYWNGEMGIHAHNNKKQALKNTLISNSIGVKWLDCTIAGMGRGAGNTLTEELLKSLNRIQFNHSDLNLIKKFKLMKKKYNWGPSKIYEMAANYKIHPTYVQLLLTGEPFKEYRNNIKNILRNLKKSSSKFEINKLYISLNSELKNYKNNFNFIKKKFYRDVLIIGSKERLIKDLPDIKKYIKQNNIFSISLNDTKKIKENFCDIHVASHPLRIVTDFNGYSLNKNYALPYNMLNRKIKKIPKNIFNVNIKFGKNNFDKQNNVFELSTPLAIGLALQIALKIKTNKIILYGFSDAYSDLYQKSKLKFSKVLKDLNKGGNKIKLDGETDLILRTFKKQNPKVKITSINLF